MPSGVIELSRLSHLSIDRINCSEIINNEIKIEETLSVKKFNTNEVKQSSDCMFRINNGKCRIYDMNYTVVRIFLQITYSMIMRKIINNNISDVSNYI